MGPDWNSYGPIAREGLGYVLIGGLCTLASWLAFDVWGIPILFLILTVFVAFFFRNPGRLIPIDPDAIVSPADGKVMIAQSLPTPPGSSPKFKIAIFLSIVNVHINRAPMAGTAKRIIYHPGKFALAFRAKESELNERNEILLEDDLKRRITVTQIAGWVARRIICYLKELSYVNCGDRIGLIQFGSRVDLTIEGAIEPHVKVGDSVRGGSTILAHFVQQSCVAALQKKRGEKRMHDPQT